MKTTPTNRQTRMIESRVTIELRQFDNGITKGGATSHTFVSTTDQKLADTAFQAVTTEVVDFLTLVSLGNTEADRLSELAAELLEKFGFNTRRGGYRRRFVIAGGEKTIKQNVQSE